MAFAMILGKKIRVFFVLLILEWLLQLRALHGFPHDSSDGCVKFVYFVHGTALFARHHFSFQCFRVPLLFLDLFTFSRATFFLVRACSSLDLLIQGNLQQQELTQTRSTGPTTRTSLHASPSSRLQRSSSRVPWSLFTVARFPSHVYHCFCKKNTI